MTRITPAIFLLVFLLTSAITSAAGKKLKTKYVFLITSDGIRHEELSGAEVNSRWPQFRLTNRPSPIQI